MNSNACPRESVKAQGPSAALGTDADLSAITMESFATEDGSHFLHHPLLRPPLSPSLLAFPHLVQFIFHVLVIYLKPGLQGCPTWLF